MGGHSTVLRHCVMLTLVVCVCHRATMARNINDRDADDRSSIAIHLHLSFEVEDNNGEQRSRENQREATHLVDNSRARRYGKHNGRPHLYTAPLSHRIVHFSANSTTYINFTQDTKVEFLQGWILDKWCQPESKLYHFDNATGQLTIKRGGFYSIDVHVTFKDRAFRNGFKIVTVDSTRQQSDGYHHQQLLQQQEEKDKEESITGCVIERARYANSTDDITSTCHASTIVRLRANQTLAIATIDGYYKPMVMSAHLTYWGLYKLD